MAWERSDWQRMPVGTDAQCQPFVDPACRNGGAEVTENDIS
mgnify:CR=1 FL=1|jgi:hypothetical protein